MLQKKRIIESKWKICDQQRCVVTNDHFLTFKKEI